MKFMMNKQFTKFKEKQDQERQCAWNCAIPLVNKKLEYEGFYTLSFYIKSRAKSFEFYFHAH